MGERRREVRDFDKCGDGRPTVGALDPVMALIAGALAVGDEDEHEYWDHVRALQDRGDRETFDAAWALCGSSRPLERALGVNILAQGQARRKTFHDEAVSTLLELLDHESDPRVLSSLGYALGHRWDERTVGPILEFKSHPDANVRFSAVMALLCHSDDRAIQALIGLSADEDSDVRDWATFGLGSQIDIDTPEIGEALVARLTDPDVDTRAEALVGLARRQDPRAVEPLLHELAASYVPWITLDAASEMRDDRVYQALFTLRERPDVQVDQNQLEYAIARHEAQP